MQGMIDYQHFRKRNMEYFFIIIEHNEKKTTIILHYFSTNKHMVKRSNYK